MLYSVNYKERNEVDTIMALTVTSKLTNSTLNPKLVKILQDLENKIPESSGSNVEIVSTSLKKAYLDCDVQENLQFDFVRRIYADFNYFAIGIFVYTYKSTSVQAVTDLSVIINRVTGTQAPTYSYVFSPFSDTSPSISSCTYYYDRELKTKIELNVSGGRVRTAYIPYIGIK